MSSWKIRTSAGVLTAFTGLLLLTGCSGDANGADTPRDVVDAYVTALNEEDTEALNRLIPPGNNADAEIEELLKAHGGKEITLSEAAITSEDFRKVATARLSGVGTAGSYSETLTITQNGDRWYVALGRNPDPNKIPTSSVDRPT
ncbi:hypothetical protein [Rhizohabitans arisaemae]|uniref:hypothetical protein n=1 Tax=Rhizohabitans arisaemae TaxID=2720610 RepID=UPI0024B15283|nr:hypothetical protein [Rhizohabitans arisaemae]